MPDLTAQYNTAIIANPDVRFFAGYVQRWQYYFCDIGGVQFVYKWDIKQQDGTLGAWSIFEGWPTGPVMMTSDEDGLPTVFIAQWDGDSPKWAEVGLDYTLDNGSAPSVYFTSAYLHMGDPEKLKEFGWVAPFVYDTGTTYSVVATTMPLKDASFQTSDELLFETPGTGSSPFIWDESLLDGGDVWAGPTVAPIGLGTPLINHGRLVTEVELTGILTGITRKQQMTGTALQVTVSYDDGTMDFELVGLQVRYIDRGYRRDGGNQYSSEGGVSTAFNANVPPLGA